MSRVHCCKTLHYPGNESVRIPPLHLLLSNEQRATFDRRVEAVPPVAGAGRLPPQQTSAKCDMPSSTPDLRIP